MGIRPHFYKYDWGTLVFALYYNWFCTSVTTLFVSVSRIEWGLSDLLTLMLCSLLNFLMHLRMYMCTSYSCTLLIFMEMVKICHKTCLFWLNYVVVLAAYSNICMNIKLRWAVHNYNKNMWMYIQTSIHTYTGAALAIRLVRFGPDHFLNFFNIVASYKSL